MVQTASFSIQLVYSCTVLEHFFSKAVLTSIISYKITFILALELMHIRDHKIFQENSTPQQFMQVQKLALPATINYPDVVSYLLSALPQITQHNKAFCSMIIKKDEDKYNCLPYSKNDQSRNSSTEKIGEREQEAIHLSNVILYEYLFEYQLLTA